MFNRKIRSEEFEPARLYLGDEVAFSGRGKAWLVPDVDRVNEIEAVFEADLEDRETIEGHAEEPWKFEGMATDNAGTLKYRVSASMTVETVEAMHTAPVLQIRLRWDGSEYQVTPSLQT